MDNKKMGIPTNIHRSGFSWLGIPLTVSLVLCAANPYRAAAGWVQVEVEMNPAHQYGGAECAYWGSSCDVAGGTSFVRTKYCCWTPCDGLQEERCGHTWNSRATFVWQEPDCLDNDNDGFFACDIGCSLTGTDPLRCDADDAASNSHPNKELCDGVDNDGDGDTDEGCEHMECLEQPVGSSVNMATGNLKNEQELFLVPGLGGLEPLVLEYNSLDSGGSAGLGWRHKYEMRLQINLTGDYVLESVPGTPLADLPVPVPHMTDGYFLRRGYGRDVSLVADGQVFRPRNSLYPRLQQEADGSYSLFLKDGTVYSFDSDGKLAGMLAPNGRRVVLSYLPGTFDLERIEDPEHGQSVSFTYDASHYLETATDLNNNLYQFAVVNDLLTSIASTNLEGTETRTWEFQYALHTNYFPGPRYPGGPANYSRAYMTEKTDPLGHTTSYEYDTGFRVLKTVDPGQNERLITYATDGNYSIYTSPDGGQWTYEYDAVTGRLMRKVQAESGGPERSYTYHADGTLATFTDEEGSTTTFTYDAAGNLLTRSVPFTDGSGNPAVSTTTLSYTVDNLVDTITDPSGRVTDFDYDATGNLIRATEPDSATTEMTYTADGELETVRNPLGQVTRYTWDEHGHLDTITNETTGAVVDLNYDISGNLTALADPRRNLWQFEYTRFNELKAVIPPDDGDPFRIWPDEYRTTYQYDALGNRVSATDPQGNTWAYEYNYRNKLSKVTDPEGNVTVYDYSSPGCGSCGTEEQNLRSLTDGNGATTVFDYDLLGRLQMQTDPMGDAIRFTYHPGGRLKEVIDAAGSVTSFAYDERGLLTTRTDPSNRQTVYRHDAAGHLTTRTDRKGDTLTYEYWPDGNLKSITYPDAHTTLFQYDPIGRLTSMTDRLGTSTYVYDDVNRTLTVTEARGFVTRYTYDIAGNLSELAYPKVGGPDFDRRVTYIYDEQNRLSTVTSWLNDTAVYTYDAAGLPATLRNLNGTLTTFSYDRVGRLKTLQSRKASTAPVVSYDYQRDGVGNIISTVREEPALNAHVSGLTDYEYNLQKNRLALAGVLTFEFDGEGQLQARGPDGFTFDSDRHLSTMSGSIAASFRYDGLGNRLEAIRDGMITRYIYDLDGNLLAEANASNSITRYYVYGAGLIAAITAGGESYTYHFNATGSTVAVTDELQTVVNAYAYTPFGIITSETELIPQPFKYVGQYGVMAESSGFYYMRARYYDPQTGRFISEDPIGFSGGTINLQEYVGNDPVNRVDPWGLEEDEVANGGRILKAINRFMKYLDEYLNPDVRKERPKTAQDVGKEQIKQWQDAIEQAKTVYDACRGNMTDLGACSNCCKTIAHESPGFTKGDASGWWVPYDACVWYGCHSICKE